MNRVRKKEGGEGTIKRKRKGKIRKGKNLKKKKKR